MSSVLRFSEEHQAWIVVRTQSLVGVFVKSLHLLALTWVATVAGLGMWVDPSAAPVGSILAHAALPALAIEGMAWSIVRWTTSLAPLPYSPRREWTRALSWATFPIVLLVAAAFVTAA